jgi:outer membrane protein assembly factor BamB
MSTVTLSSFPLFLVSLILPVVCFSGDAPDPRAPEAAAASAADDWSTWGYDQERTGWNRGETTLSKHNVKKLKLQWSAQLSTQPTDVALSTVTAPLVVSGVRTSQGAKSLVFLLGADDTMFALDADSGNIVWQKTFINPIKPARPANWLCANAANATPVIDKKTSVIYFITSDGKLRGLELGDGAEYLTPTQMIAPFARAWSLNLIDHVVYTTSGRACGEIFDLNSALAAATVTARTPAPTSGPIPDASAASAMDVRDPAHPQVTRFYTSNARSAGPWGRGALARGPNDTVILETDDGLYDPAAGQFGDTILLLAPKATKLVDSFTPKNHKYLMSKDLAGSASPVVFPFGKNTLVAVGQKEGIVCLLDATDLGGGPPDGHAKPFYQSPQLGNDDAQGTDPGQGVWGAMTTYETPDGRRFLYVPMYGPPSKNAPTFKHTNGPIPNGSIMAFQVVADGDKVSLDPQWTSSDMILPDPPVVANDVLYAIQTGGQARQNTPMPDGSPRDPATTGAHYRATPVSNLVLYAFDAETGKPLYSSKKIIADWVHFSEPVVALGKVFLVTHDAHVYAFGLTK